MPATQATKPMCAKCGDPITPGSYVTYLESRLFHGSGECFPDGACRTLFIGGPVPREVAARLTGKSLASVIEAHMIDARRPCCAVSAS